MDTIPKVSIISSAPENSVRFFINKTTTGIEKPYRLPPLESVFDFEIDYIPEETTRTEEETRKLYGEELNEAILKFADSRGARSSIFIKRGRQEVNRSWSYDSRMWDVEYAVCDFLGVSRRLNESWSVQELTRLYKSWHLFTASEVTLRTISEEDKVESREDLGFEGGASFSRTILDNVLVKIMELESLFGIDRTKTQNNQEFPPDIEQMLALAIKDYPELGEGNMRSILRAIKNAREIFDYPDLKTRRHLLKKFHSDTNGVYKVGDAKMKTLGEAVRFIDSLYNDTNQRFKI